LDVPQQSEPARPAAEAPAGSRTDGGPLPSPPAVRRSLLWKQALFVAGLVVLCAGVVSAVGYFVARGILRDQIHERLNVVAADRRTRLENYATHQLHQVGLIASRTRLREVLEDYLDGAVGLEVFRDESEQILRDALQSDPEQRAVWIVDLDGRVLTSTDDERLDADFSTQEDFLEGQRHRHLGVPHEVDGSLRIHVSAPARGDGGQLLGVVMIALDVAPLHELLSDTTGLGETGEVLVGTEVGGRLRYLLPRSGRNDVPPPIKELPPMQAALRGARGHGTSEVCGEEVLAAYAPAAYQPTAERTWGVVAMLSTDEAYAPVARLRRLLLLIQGLLLVGGVGVAFVLARRLTRPILELSRKATSLAEGDLTSRAAVRSEDELGLLAVSFNHMAERLAHTYGELERRVGERTAALARANEELQREIAERKRFEQTLRESEALHHSLVESLPLNVFRKDLQGRIQFANQRFCETVGRPLADLVGKTDADLFPREYAEKYRRDDARVIGTGEVLEDVEEHRRPDGSLIYVHVLKAPLRDADGRIVGVQGMFWDVTARKKAEAALEQERTLLHALMDHLPHNIYFKDTQSRFTRINKAMADYVGLSHPREAIGKSDFDLFTGEHAEPARADELEVMRSGRAIVDKEEKETWPGGSVNWVSTTKLPLYDEEGRVIGTFGISRDVTEQHRAAEALRAAKEAAEAANRAKSVFLANVSHEIRTPMNAILGMTELVLSTPLSDEQREFLSVVRESGEVLLSVINDILDFSKIEAGKLELEPSVFDVRELLGDTMKSLAVRAHAEGLELACRIHPDVPDLVLGDRVRLRQVVVNLVGNAVKFTERGEVVLEVERESSEDRDIVLHFIVSDTGIGIPENKLAAIFEMFEQADSTTTRRFGGTGLGLAICAKLTELMGGRVWVESRVDQGSRFHFTARFETVAEHTGPPASGRPDAIVGMRVLAVDDNATNRRIIEEVLRSWSMRPGSASSAADALTLLHEAHREGDPYRLVLVDVQMPTVDGFTLAERIKQHDELQSTVIMMLTSSDKPGDLQRCERLGIACYVRKPVKQSELFDAIMMAIGASELDRVEPAPPAAAAIGRPLLVLLAEDSLVNQKVATALLTRHGHRVVVANNGKEAVDAAASRGFDAVLMDVQMPEMDGFEATAAIRLRERQSGRRVPIIAMTAHALKGDRERCLEAGMDDYVSKPIRADELFEVLAAVTSGRRPPEPGAAEPSAPETGPAPAAEAETPPAEAASRPEPGPAAGIPSSPPDAGPPADPVDWDAALAGVRGDRDLLRDIARAALEESPRLVEDIERALTRGDATALRLSAHTLKGSIRYFEAKQAFEYAYQLETMGKNDDMENAGTVLHALKEEISRLSEALGKHLRAEDAAQSS